MSSLFSPVIAGQYLDEDAKCKLKQLSNVATLQLSHTLSIPKLPKLVAARRYTRAAKNTTILSVVYEQRWNVLFARKVMHGECIVKGTS